MIDPDLRDFKVEWQVEGMGTKLLYVAQTHGDGSTTKLWLTARQAQELARVAAGKEK